MPASIIGSPQNLRALLADVRSMPFDRAAPSPSAPATPRPFVTISREPGIPASDLGNALVEALNTAMPPADDREAAWSGWDRELVEKVAHDTGLSRDMIEALEESNRSWLTDFFSGLSGDDRSTQPDADAAFRRVAGTVGALAEFGRTVIVGCGGVFITRHLPSGIHVRLVAPEEYRVARLAEAMHLTPAKAAQRLAELDRNRQAFFKRHWPNEELKPELFTLTVNAATVPMDLAVETIVKLVRRVR